VVHQRAVSEDVVVVDSGGVAEDVVGVAEVTAKETEEIILETRIMANRSRTCL